MENNLIQLIEQLTKADYEYYVLDEPSLSDEDYDLKCKMYEELTGEVWNCSVVPGEPRGEFIKVPHPHKAKSLDKVNSEEELRIKSKILAKEGLLVVQKKFDGITLVIYPDGVIATRGNGEEGEDVTHTTGFLLKNKKPLDNPIRGELLIPKDRLNLINKDRIAKGKKPYKNCRNAVAGMVRNLDPKEMYPQHIRFYAYNLLDSGMSEIQQLQALSNAGYTIPDCDAYNTVDATWEAVCKIGEEREYLDYEIDGAVVKSNNPRGIEIFGETMHHYNNAFAYKYENQGEWTKLIEVVWETGRTGKITPVALVEPVDINGSTISRVSLHNASMIKRLGLCYNDRVFVVKNNDVIPGIAKREPNDEDMIPVKEPDRCVCCNTKATRIDSVEHEGVYQLYCLSENCTMKIGRRIENMAKEDALNIEGLSIKTIDKMINAGYINNLIDIFFITVEELQELPGFARPSAEKLHKTIQMATLTDLASYITACGIPLVARKKAEDIANKFRNISSILEDIQDNFGNGIKSIEGIGDTVVDSILANVDKLTELLPVITIGQKKQEYVFPKPDKQLTIVVTGSFKTPEGDKLSRKVIEETIKQYGHKCTGSVSKSTDYVLAGEKSGSKEDKAKELGIPIIRSMKELHDII